MHRLASALLTIWLVSSVAATAAQDAPAGDRYQLLADTGGPIGQVVISVNSARNAALRNAALISNIVNGLPAGTHFGIITNDRDAFTVARNPWPERISFIELPANNPITIWTQDPFLVLHNAAGDVRLLTPREFDRAGDRAMAAEVAARYGYDVMESKLFFEGGNIVSDEQHVFIGANTIRYNANRWVLTEAQIVGLFEKELGRKVLVVGPLPQPIGHIDMMMTPLGDRRIALADTAAGAAIVGELLANDAGAIERFETSTEASFFGAPGIRTLKLLDGRTLTAPALGGRTAAMVTASESMAPVLDGIAAALQSHGYEVVRIPMLYGGPESEAPAGTPAEEAEAGSAVTYPMLTYNNVLIEHAESTATVYAPVYGLAELDEAAAAAWQALGFAVRPVTGLTISAMYGGVLRCSVKVLEREDSQ